MFQWDVGHKVDFWGFGFELSVQYKHRDEEHTIKEPIGIALTICLITREFKLGYFWGLD